MNIVVLKELEAGENRVALVPDSVRKLTKLGANVLVEAGAGLEAGATDEAYTAAGATVTGDRKSLLAEASILVAVNRPTHGDLSHLKPGTAVLGFLRPLDEPGALLPLPAQGLVAFALELVPRISRAQSMDALSSMATVAGYKAVVEAAVRLPRLFPMLMTAAGTLAPARVLILGAGVAGLQAIATARRLGAAVEAFDVRPAAGEQVRSLGATFLEVDLGKVETAAASGYAVELGDDTMRPARQLIEERAKQVDVIITTALVPGRPAPLLITETAVANMKPGSIIVDLAAVTGGNCALTVPGQNILLDTGVTLLGPLNLAATVPTDASQLLSHNITAFLTALIKEGELHINFEDQVVRDSCVCSGTEYVNPRLRDLWDVQASSGAAVTPVASDNGPASGPVSPDRVAALSA